VSLPEIFHPTGQPNLCLVRVGDMHYWFSYTTCVAFYSTEFGLTVSENIWSKTTGKHLNYIDPTHTNRVPYAEFLRRLAVIQDNITITEFAT
jgi:hypothetical protein